MHKHRQMNSGCIQLPEIKEIKQSNEEMMKPQKSNKRISRKQNIKLLTPRNFETKLVPDRLIKQKHFISNNKQMQNQRALKLICPKSNAIINQNNVQNDDPNLQINNSESQSPNFLQNCQILAKIKSQKMFKSLLIQKNFVESMNYQEIKYANIKLEQQIKKLQNEIFLKDALIIDLKVQLHQIKSTTLQNSEIIQSLKIKIKEQKQIIQSYENASKIQQNANQGGRENKSTTTLQLSQRQSLIQNQNDHLIIALQDKLKYSQIENRMLQRNIFSVTKRLQTQCAQMKLQNRQLRQKIKQIKQIKRVTQIYSAKQSQNCSFSLQLSKQQRDY